MASITLRGLVDAIVELDIEGVRENFKEPPVNVDRPSLPALWPELPSLGRGELLWGCSDLNATASMSFVVAVDAYGQKEQGIRFNAAVDMADAVKTAVSQLSELGNAAFFSNFVDFEIEVTTEIQTIEALFWGIRATITARNTP